MMQGEIIPGSVQGYSPTRAATSRRSWRPFYDVTVEEGALVARHLDMADPLTLRHTGGDDFSSSVVFLNTIAFERAGNGRITGFTVSNGRTKGVWFQKM